MRADDPVTALRLRRYGAAVAASCSVAAVLYATWVIGAVVNPGIDELYGYVSELSARDQPGSSLFRAADAAAGTLAVCAAVLAVRRHRFRQMPSRTAGRWALAGWGGLVLFGIATTADAALTPMDCATFTHSGCALREAFGGSSLAHHLHAVTSTLAGAGALAGMAALGLASRRGVPLLPVPRTALVFGGVTALASVATLLSLLLGGWAGLFQRIQLAAVSGWLLALAFVAVPRAASDTARRRG